MRLTVPGLVDGFVLLLACKTAAVLVLQMPPGSSPGLEVVAWYALAALYAACACVCGYRPRTTDAVDVFARTCLLFGVLLSACLMRHFGEPTQPSPVQSLDWLVLGVCFGCSALLQRPHRNK